MIKNNQKHKGTSTRADENNPCTASILFTNDTFDSKSTSNPVFEI